MITIDKADLVSVKNKIQIQTLNPISGQIAACTWHQLSIERAMDQLLGDEMATIWSQTQEMLQ